LVFYVFSDLSWEVNILKTEVSIYHIVKRIIGLLCVQWYELRGEHPKTEVSIYHIVKRIIGLLSVQWFEVRGEHPETEVSIYHIVKRIIGLVCVQWFEVRGEHPKNRSKYISYCKTYYWPFLCSVIWGERWTS
jgi:hypothetical protein